MSGTGPAPGLELLFTAIDEQFSPRHIAALVRGEEEDSSGDLLGPAETGPSALLTRSGPEVPAVGRSAPGRPGRGGGSDHR